MRGLEGRRRRPRLHAAQLALAWCTKNRHVSTVITGASRPEQVHENMVALDVAKRLDRDVMARIEAAVPFTG